MIYLVVHLKAYKHKGTRSSWLTGTRTPYRTSSMSRAPQVNEDASDEGSDDEGYDGEESVAGTETTETSETNSLGSLTSVD
jgi:transcription elongation factor